jgi:hypothetical protein
MILKKAAAQGSTITSEKAQFYQVARLRQSTLVYKIRLKIYNVLTGIGYFQR